MSKLSADTSRFLFTVADMDFLVSSFKAGEHLSQLFSVSLELATPEEIDSETVVDQPGLLTLCSDDEDRFFNGFVYQFFKTGRKGRFHTYKAQLSPQAVLLGQRSDCRIFQNLTVPDIVGQVLKAAGITADLFAFRLQGKYPQRDYCVQYRETDLNFIRRLLAEEGIFFFFEHSRDKHLMVFGDSTACYQPIAGDRQIPWNPGGGLTAEQEAVIGFEHGRCTLTGKYTQRDFNFEKPALDLTTDHQDSSNGELARFDYPGDYQLPEQGSRLAKVRLQQAALDRNPAGGKSVVVRFLPGFTFTLTDSLSDSQDGDYLLTGIEHQGEQPQVLAEQSDSEKGTRYLNTFKAIPAAVTYRPDPGKPIKPFVRGTQTAIVTGPAGEEIYTDRFGRVKVQFHWDRQGKRDEQSSCWIRVSQGWAGEGWGAMHLPRIGQEVVVSFLEGDPDRPLITGRVYHGTNLPPYALPEHKTRSTIKSNTSPGGNGSNELRFEDKKDAEEIYLHGQKDWNIVIENDKAQRIGRDESLDVGNNRAKTVAKDQKETIGASKSTNVGENYDETIGRNKTIQVGADHSEAIKQNADITIGGDLTQTIGKSETRKIGKDYSVDISGNADELVGGDKRVEVSQSTKIHSGGKIQTSSNTQVSLESGSGVIVIKQNGAITLSGTAIDMKALGAIALKGAKIFSN